ncbi:MAG: hypothetical protein ABI766_05070 [Gemmatimonadales bacterium]
MTVCEQLSDSMPDIALRRRVWSAEEETHLTACADCRSEWRLVEIAAGLGDSLPASRDWNVVATGIVGRVATERSAARIRRRGWAAAGLAAAAVAILAVRTARPPLQLPVPVPVPVATVHAPPPVSSSTTQSLPLPELDGLPVSQLESILGVLDASPDISSSLDGPAFDDMDGAELDRALAAWEG